MFLFHKKGLKLDGANPVILTGYGGFNSSQTPRFSPSYLLWAERGGILAGHPASLNCNHSAVPCNDAVADRGCDPDHDYRSD